jgi:nucleotide-binding universal stress UspA family protein
MSWPHDALRRILVAVDGSPPSIRAAEAAVALAVQTGAEIVFLHVLDEQTLRQLAALVPEDMESLRKRLADSFARTLAHLSELARDGGRDDELPRSREVSASTRIEEGDPPSVIDRVARELATDLILVGKTGHRGVQKLLVGSVTRRLIETTGIPVLVIPGAAPGAGA